MITLSYINSKRFLGKSPQDPTCVPTISISQLIIAICLCFDSSLMSAPSPSCDLPLSNPLVAISFHLNCHRMLHSCPLLALLWTLPEMYHTIALFLGQTTASHFHQSSLRVCNTAMKATEHLTLMRSLNVFRHYLHTFVAQFASSEERSSTESE